jgi:hypothetical protein
MAHVLMWYDESVVRQFLQVIAEEEFGHTLTTATSFWEALAVLRASLHPMVVVYDGCLLHALRPDEEEALSAQRAALRSHGYVATSACFSPLPPRVQAVVADLDTETLYLPWELSSVIAAIERAAARLARRGA